MKVLWQAYDGNKVYDLDNCIIGASLSEPHHVRSTVKFVFLLACLLACMFVCMLVTALYG